MKKILLVMLSALICSTSITSADAKTFKTPEVTNAIKMYKSQNYTQCYEYLHEVVAKDPSNPLAYYYLAITSVQVGKRNEAIENYEKVLSLSPKGNLKRYAIKGKLCAENPDACLNGANADVFEKFVTSKYGTGFSDKVREDYENQRIQNLMREMNRNSNIDPKKFKDFKDYSSEVPSNEEIVAAMRVLQRAGFGNLMASNNSFDISMLGGQNNSQSQLFNTLNMNNNNMSNLSPQVIQSLLTNQMSTGF